MSDTYTTISGASARVAGPTLIGSSHANGATGVAVTDTRIVLTFSEAIAVDRYAVVVTDQNGYMLRQEIGANGMHAAGNQLFIKPEGFFTSGSYTIELPAGSVTNMSGNAYAGPDRISFSTAQAVASGSAGNDLLIGGQGKRVDGGAGIDTAQYGGYWGEYTIKHVESGFTVQRSNGGVTDTLAGVERLLFQERAVALDIDGNGGQAYRLYRAAFDREPDQGGVGFWITQLDRGLALQDAAKGFLASAEFKDLYGGAPSDELLVGQLYRNILHREPEQGGFDFWVARLEEGMSREHLLVSFSESNENVDAVADLIAHGFSYQPY